jgi:hypothetical protein
VEQRRALLDQAASRRRLTVGSPLNDAMVSYSGRVRQPSSFCSSRTAPISRLAVATALSAV